MPYNNWLWLWMRGFDMVKKWVFWGILLLSLCAVCRIYGEDAKALKASGYVNDYAQILNEQTAFNIAGMAGLVERATGAQLTFVSVHDLGEASIEEWAVDLFHQWGIGQKGKDNGVLVVVALQERKMRIEVGYGLEGALPDGWCGDVIREVGQRFRELGYNEGVTYAMFTLGNRVAAEYNVSLEELLKNSSIDYDNLQQSAHKLNQGQRVLKIFFAILFVLMLFGRMGLWPLFFGASMMSHRRDDYWRHGGGGSFGGGFGGFGGGSSGGGGASGSW